MPCPPAAALPAPHYPIGIDGGGTSPRAGLADAGGGRLGEAGPSALSQGAAQAWLHVWQAVERAFADGGLAPTHP